MNVEHYGANDEPQGHSDPHHDATRHPRPFAFDHCWPVLGDHLGENGV
jgi:hypothetical protein